MTLKHKVATLAASAVAGTVGLGGKRFSALVQARLSQARRPELARALKIRIHAPDIVAPDPADLPLARRVFAAFRRAKRDQARTDRRYLPASLWQRQLDQAYASLSESLLLDDPAPLHHFLANFGAWHEYTGIEHTVLIREHAAEAGKRRVFERVLMPRILDAWLATEAQGRPVSALHTPPYGNQAGSMVDGKFISLSSVFDDVYARLVARWVPGEHPLVAELGSGYGKFFSFIARSLSPGFRYVAFDLPETLTCASYYLMKVFPDRKFLLYGEEPFTADCLRRYDFVMMPSFEIGTLPDRSVDVFLNRSSLGEMAPEATRLFVKEIARVADVFWHMNHEVLRNSLEGGEATLLNAEYPVPKEFELVVRYLDTWSPLYHLEPRGWETCWYLYRRRGTQHPG